MYESLRCAARNTYTALEALCAMAKKRIAKKKNGKILEDKLAKLFGLDLAKLIAKDLQRSK